MPKRPSLSIASSSSAAVKLPRNDPPRDLGKYGLDLWNRITNSYAIEDEGGRSVLAEACSAWERAERLRQQINRDGETIQTRPELEITPA